MTNLKSLTIWTIVLNFFILAGFGHGLICVGILEIFSIITVVTGHFTDNAYFSFSLSASYDESLIAVGIFSLLGQTLIIISFFIKGRNKFWFKIVGLFFLFTGFYYLTHNFINDPGSQLGFFTGIPFLILSGVLIYKITTEKFRKLITD